MTKKTLAKKIKSFLQPTEEDEYSPDLSASIVRLTERIEALERKNELILSRLSSLPAEIRNAVQSRSGFNSVQGTPPAQSQAYPRSAPMQHTRPVPVSAPVTQSSSSAQGTGRMGRRDRMLFKAICADCRKDCEVPVKPTEGRPVYCKPCFSLRKAAKSVPVKNADVPVSPIRQAAEIPLGNTLPGIPQRSAAGHVPPQIHNLARRSAVAYMAKKAGHGTSPQPVLPQTAAGGASARVSAAKSAGRSKPVRSERPKPKKRSR